MQNASTGTGYITTLTRHPLIPQPIPSPHSLFHARQTTPECTFGVIVRGRRRVLQYLCRAKVGEFDMPVGCKQHILGLQVAVQHPLRVHILHRGQQLGSDEAR